MNREQLSEEYVNQDYNCAEAILRVANREYDLHIPEESLRLVSGFGGGMGCGDACGALSSVVAVISTLLVKERAHATEGFKEKCAAVCQEFSRLEGSTSCADIKEKNSVEGLRCFKTVEDAYGILERFLQKEGLISLPEEKVTVTAEDIKRVKGLGFLHNRGTNNFSGRVITRNGKVTAEENMKIAEAARRFGDGHIALTTRLTMEVTGIPYENIQPFRDFLQEAGLESGGTGSKVRPVVACKGTTCQYGLCDTFALADEIHHRFYEGYSDVKLPHKFKIAVGGCPNNCVKPDLNDFGIIGQRIPVVDADKCQGCSCVIEKGCPIGIAGLQDGKLVIPEESCNRCGRCIGKCPFGAVTGEVYGYKVVIGGRWGKKSAQGQALSRIFTTKEEALSVLEKAILLFREQGKTGERFSDTIERIGFADVEAQLLDDGLLKRKTDIIDAQVHLVGGATC